MAATVVVGTNSLISEAEANTYLEGSARANCKWDFAGIDPSANARFLISAQRLMNRQCYEGTKTVSTQALPFPRDGLTDREGNSLADNTTPQDVKDAQAEWALLLTIDPESEGTVDQGTNVKRVKAGSATVTFFSATTGQLERVPENVFELLQPYIKSSTVSDGAVATGVSEVTSSFGGPYCITRPVS